MTVGLRIQTGAKQIARARGQVLKERVSETFSFAFMVEYHQTPYERIGASRVLRYPRTGISKISKLKYPLCPVVLS